MKKYINKVRFVTLKFLYIIIYNKNNKHELIFGKQQTVSTTEKIDCKQIME